MVVLRDGYPFDGACAWFSEIAFDRCQDVYIVRPVSLSVWRFINYSSLNLFMCINTSFLFFRLWSFVPHSAAPDLFLYFIDGTRTAPPLRRRGGSTSPSNSRWTSALTTNDYARLHAVQAKGGGSAPPLDARLCIGRRRPRGRRSDRQGD